MGGVTARFNRFNLAREHINRGLAHLSRSGKTLVSGKMRAHTILPALDMMVWDLHP
jgi:hypothetical protein